VSRMEKKTFVKGAVILGIAGLIVQIMGAVFRIPLANIIGPKGMGYFQTAYPIYVFLLVFSTNGAPAAISKMTAERLALGKKREAHLVFKSSFILMAIIGAVAFLLIFFFAEGIVSQVGDKGAVLAMKAISPALLFVPIMSVYRGYFQGMQNMVPTASSQLIEQGVRVIVGLSLAIILVNKSISWAAAGATLGTSVGPVAGVLFLMILYQLKHPVIDSEERITESKGRIILTLLKISVPVTIGISIIPIINIGDLLIVMNRLKAIGFTMEQANMMYGQLTGMAGPIINIPMAMALSMALAIVPAVASASAAGDKELLSKNIGLGFRTAMIVGVPTSLGLILLAEPIMLLLYPMEKESAIYASGSLAFLAAGVIFLCVAQTMAGILQGLGRPGTAVFTLGVSFLVKIIFTWILTGVETLNIEGAALGSSLAFFTVGILNYYMVKRISGFAFEWRVSAVKPIISGIAMFIAAGIFYNVFDGIIGNAPSVLLAVLLGALIYTAVLVKIKGITEKELAAFPKGNVILRFLKAMKLM